MAHVQRLRRHCAAATTIASHPHKAGDLMLKCAVPVANIHTHRTLLNSTNSSKQIVITSLPPSKSQAIASYKWNFLASKTLASWESGKCSLYISHTSNKGRYIETDVNDVKSQ